MKPLIFAGFLLVYLQGFAQKPIAENDLPAAILEGFELAYPDLPPRTWEQRNTRFVATIKYEDHVETATFLEDGEWAETRSNTDRASLPEEIITFIDSRYTAYRIQDLHYVEENGGGKYYAILLVLRSNRNLTTELFFDMGGDILMIDGMPVTENLDGSTVVNPDGTVGLLRPGIQKEIVDENKGVPEVVLLNLARRYGAVENIKWKRTDLGFHRGEYRFREETIATEWDDAGNQVSVITFFNRRNAVYAIQRFLSENYPRATFVSGERVTYESRFTRTFPERGLRSYFEVVISDRPRGVRTPTVYTIYFDQTGQLDMIVEKTDSNGNE